MRNMVGLRNSINVSSCQISLMFEICHLNMSDMHISPFPRQCMWSLSRDVLNCWCLKGAGTGSLGLVTCLDFISLMRCRNECC